VNLDLRRTIRYYFIRLKRLQGTPYSLAMGAAIGAAIAITPTLPLHTVLIVCITLALRVNTIAAIIVATLISNPMTFIPQYWLAWWIGNFFFPGRLDWQRLKSVLDLLLHEGMMDSLQTLSHLGFDAALVLLTGGVVLAVPVGFVTYFITYRFFENIQKRRARKAADREQGTE